MPSSILTKYEKVVSFQIFFILICIIIICVIMEIKKKLDLMRIGKHLQDVYQRELMGFSVAEQPELKRVGLLGEKDEAHTFAVVVSFINKENPDVKCYVLYYPLANETSLEKNVFLSTSYLKHDRVYVGNAYVRLYFDTRIDDFCLEFKQFPKEAPKNENEARLRLNARLLFSSNHLWEREAFVPNKSLLPYFDGQKYGYFYEFEHKECAVEVSNSVERCFDAGKLTFLNAPKLLTLPSGKVFYFTGTHFVRRHSEILNKDEVRGMFKVIQKHYPNIKFYGHLIPIYENACVPENAAWVVGQADGKFIVVNLLTKDVHERAAQFELAAPDDKNFFDSKKE